MILHFGMEKKYQQMDFIVSVYEHGFETFKAQFYSLLYSSKQVFKVVRKTPRQSGKQTHFDICKN